MDELRAVQCRQTVLEMRDGWKQAALKQPDPLESSPLQQQGLSAGKCEIRLGAWLM